MRDIENGRTNARPATAFSWDAVLKDHERQRPANCMFDQNLARRIWLNEEGIDWPTLQAMPGGRRRRGLRTAVGLSDVSYARAIDVDCLDFRQIENTDDERPIFYLHWNNAESRPRYLRDDEESESERWFREAQLRLFGTIEAWVGLHNLPVELELTDEEIAERLAVETEARHRAAMASIDLGAIREAAEAAQAGPSGQDRFSTLVSADVVIELLDRLEGRPG